MLYFDNFLKSMLLFTKLKASSSSYVSQCVRVSVCLVTCRYHIEIAARIELVFS